MAKYELSYSGLLNYVNGCAITMSKKVRRDNGIDG